MEVLCKSFNIGRECTILYIVVITDILNFVNAGEELVICLTGENAT